MKKNTFIKILSAIFLLNLLFINKSFSQPVTGISENFDAVTAPALPAGWQSVSLAGATTAVTSNAMFDSNPNAAFLPNLNTVTDLALVSPAITFNSGTSTYDLFVEFRHKRGMESGFDLGVLELSINDSAFKDFKDPSFNVTDISGDYNRLTPLNNPLNPLNGRSGWTGTSATFETVAFKINNLANNASIKFRFRIGTDQIIGSSGWFIDDFSVTPLIDTSCKVEPFNTDVLAGQKASFTLSINNPSSVSVPPGAGLVSLYSGYKIDNFSFMPGITTSPITFIPLPGGNTFQFIESVLIDPNSSKKYKIDLNTSNPPQASAKITFNVAANPVFNGAEVGATFLSSSINLPEAGLNNLPVFPDNSTDFCNPLPAPVPVGLSGSLIINFNPTACTAGQAALNAQNAGALAYVGLPISAILTDPFNPPASYIIEPATPGLNIPVFTIDQFQLSNFSLVALPANAATRASISGSNDPQKSTLLVSMQYINGDSESFGNNFCAGMVNLVTDQDADGTFDYLDGCIADPAKTTAGVCGCGAVDIDANSNGIIDCLTVQEAEDARIKSEKAAEELRKKEEEVRLKEENRKKLFTSDFKTKVSNLLTNLNKIKQKKFNKQKTERNAAKLSIDEIVQLSQNKADILLTSSAIDLSTLVNNLNTSGKKFFSKVKNFSKNKKAAVADINALLAAL